MVHRYLCIFWHENTKFSKLRLKILVIGFHPRPEMNGQFGFTKKLKNTAPYLICKGIFQPTTIRRIVAREHLY
jgi:hypothetical protein